MAELFVEHAWAPWAGLIRWIYLNDGVYKRGARKLGTGTASHGGLVIGVRYSSQCTFSLIIGIVSFRGPLQRFCLLLNRVGSGKKTSVHCEHGRRGSSLLFSCSHSACRQYKWRAATSPARTHCGSWDTKCTPASQNITPSVPSSSQVVRRVPLVVTTCYLSDYSRYDIPGGPTLQPLTTQARTSHCPAVRIL